MTNEQKLRWIILKQAHDAGDITIPVNVTADNIDDLYEELMVEQDLHWDYQSELRCGEVETGLPSPSSRHYESKSVAAKLPDGSWLGWTYWYGGGKHGEPEAIDWMNEAYELECAEEEKLVVVRTFKKTETTADA